MTLALQRLSLCSRRAVTNSRASRCSRESTSKVCHRLTAGRQEGGGKKALYGTHATTVLLYGITVWRQEVGRNRKVLDAVCSNNIGTLPPTGRLPVYKVMICSFIEGRADAAHQSINQSIGLLNTWYKSR